MTKSEFASLLETIQSEERLVCKAGQLEYAGGESADAFANFSRVSDHLNLPCEKVLLTYALKHWDGIVSYVNGHRSQREDVRGRIKDLRLYLALLWGMIDEQDIIKAQLHTSDIVEGQLPTPVKFNMNHIVCLKCMDTGVELVTREECDCLEPRAK